MNLVNDEIHLDVLQQSIERVLTSKCTPLQCVNCGSHHWIYSTTNEQNTVFLVRVQWPMLPGAITVKHKMSSEVATMYYLQNHPTIPVPPVYFHDLDPEKSVGGEWMITQPVDGWTLSSIWSYLSKYERRSACLAAADCWASLLLCRFDSIGSIYQGGETFYVGPMSMLPSNNARFIGPPETERCGPFLTAKDWLHALCRDDLQYISSYKPAPEQPEWTAECQQLIENLGIPNGPESMFVLEHVDFSPHNIMVSPNPSRRGEIMITTVLDWEGARIVPMWATNPRWIWPRSSSEEEREELIRLMRERIIRQVPGWENATGDPCKECRVVCQWAHEITMGNPDWTRPDFRPRFLYDISATA